MGSMTSYFNSSSFWRARTLMKWISCKRRCRKWITASWLKRGSTRRRTTKGSEIRVQPSIGSPAITESSSSNLKVSISSCRSNDKPLRNTSMKGRDYTMNWQSHGSRRSNWRRSSPIDRTVFDPLRNESKHSQVKLTISSTRIPVSHSEMPGWKIPWFKLSDKSC